VYLEIDYTFQTLQSILLTIATHRRIKNAATNSRERGEGRKGEEERREGERRREREERREERDKREEKREKKVPQYRLRES
jgi:hypothetical protein